MDNNNYMQINQLDVTPDQMDNMYPEVYNDIYPLVAESVDDIMRSGHTLTDAEMNYHVDNIIKMSGMWDEDEDAAAVTASAFDSRHFHRRGRRRHHNRNTLRDLTRILFLRELRDRKRRR